ncbi:MAG: glycosyltransferase family 92 protein [Selenomonadaceae bacterium]|nr:glycosyltransferase family 92 protein [Selenomonadaceae bacterium]
MSVDKDLFMYGLAAVTIVRDEAPYIKEWLDYHLLAGVDHFLIYNNESSDNLQEVLKPYVEKHLVTLIPYPKTYRQLMAYNDAVKYFKYYCRQMVFIDVDEFIFPQNGKNILDVTDEILGDNVAGLAVNLHTFGSNGFEKADYSIGVLERFTRRAEDNWTPIENNIPLGNAAVKTIADPRRLKMFVDNTHVPEYFEDYHAVNENCEVVEKFFNVPVTSNKIVINYYGTKSREEYAEKVHKRETARFVKRNEPVGFDANDRNEIFDDGILAYREKLRAEQISDGSDALKILAGRKRINGRRMFAALVRNLTPDFTKSNLKDFFANPKNRTTYFNDLIKFYKKAPPTFFAGNLETYLTCLSVSSYLRKGYLDDTTGAFFEEASLNAICKTFASNLSLLDLRLLVAELPRILAIPSATVKALVTVCLEIFPQFLEDFRVKGDIKNFEELSYLIKMLRVFSLYRK